MPARYAHAGDVHAAIDRHVCSLDRLLELSARQERDGMGDAPWPPHYRKTARRARTRAAVAASSGHHVAGAAPGRTPVKPAAPRDCAREAQSRRTRRSGAMACASRRGRRAPAALRCAGRCHAWPISDVDAHPCKSRARAGRIAPAGGTARSGERRPAPNTFASS